jgi:heme/copper-type cytochrome/quinol oxidase subunit 2
MKHLTNNLEVILAIAIGAPVCYKLGEATGTALGIRQVVLDRDLLFIIGLTIAVIVATTIGVGIYTSVKHNTSPEDNTAGHEISPAIH